jgi:hypothetical protein
MESYVRYRVRTAQRDSGPLPYAGKCMTDDAWAIFAVGFTCTLWALCMAVYGIVLWLTPFTFTLWVPIVAALISWIVVAHGVMND